MKGVDTIAKISADTAWKLAGEGYSFVGRYCVANEGQLAQKAMVQSEIAAIHGAGLAIFPIYETTAARPAKGASAGEQDGKAAWARAAALGIPSGTIIYFCADYAVPVTDYDKVEAYLNAAAKAALPYRVGLYGPYSVIEEMSKRGAAEAYWQCSGWSGGLKSERRTMYQSAGNVTAGGIKVDLNETDTLAGMWLPETEAKTFPHTEWAERRGLTAETDPDRPATVEDVWAAVHAAAKLITSAVTKEM